MGDSQRRDIDPPEACPSWLQSLFDLSPDLMCLTSRDGDLRRVNPAVERTLGYTAEECVSRPLIDFVHPEDIERTRTAFRVLAGGDELRQFENRCICRDGSVRWLQWSCRPEPSTSGRIAAVARDITDSVRRVEQAALRKVATVVAHGTAPGDVFITVAAEIADLLDADLTLIGRKHAVAVAAGGSTDVGRQEPRLEDPGLRATGVDELRQCDRPDRGVRSPTRAAQRGGNTDSG
jgi:PAS domain S-box-containing protein